VSRRRLALLIGVPISAIILLALFSTYILPALAQGSILVKLKDSETGKPIGKVDSGYVRVMLGGLDQGYLNDEGEFKIKDVGQGTHELVLIIPRYGEKRQFVDVGAGQTVTADISVDMPNPVFQVAVGCYTTWWFNEVGHISVTLTNIGDVNSVSTSVLVIVHKEKDLSMPIATRTLDFPSLVPRKEGGGSSTLTCDCGEFVWGQKEIISVVIFDGWPYTPQNGQVVSKINAPSSMVAELANSITNYLKGNPQLATETISQILIAFFG
jgi:hypothetical protein